MSSTKKINISAPTNEKDHYLTNSITLKNYNTENNKWMKNNLKHSISNMSLWFFQRKNNMILLQTINKHNKMFSPFFFLFFFE